MTILLKQSTAVTVQFGPFVDKTDGVTLEVGLATAMDNATTGIRMSKAGAALIDRNSGTAPAYDAMGSYRINLSTTDTNTLGALRMIFEEAATCLPAWMDFMVVPANVYDSLVGGTDTLQADVTQLAGVVQSLTDLKDFADAGYDPATSKVQGVVLVDSVTGGATAAAQTTAQNDLNLITGTDGVVIGATGKTAVEAAVWDAVQDSHLTAGSTGLSMKYAGFIAANSTVNDAGATTTTFITNLTSVVDDFYVDQPLMFISGVLAGQSRIVSAYNGTTKGVTVSEPYTSAPADTTSFAIKAEHVHPEEDIAAAVWAAATRTITGTVVLDAVQGPVTFTGTGNLAGITMQGAGTAAGLQASGGPDGPGIGADGGATSGDGIRAALGGSGVDIRGNITGNLSGSVNSVTSGVTVSVNADKTGYTIANSGIGAASFAAGAIDSSAIAANAIDASALATDAINEIVNGMLGAVVESQGSVTFAQYCRLMMAVLFGVTATDGSTYKTPNGVATRVVITYSGTTEERLSVVLTP